MSNSTLKNLNLFHFLTMLFLLGIGVYYLIDYHPSRVQLWEGVEMSSFYIIPSYEYGIISCMFFSITISLGIFTLKKMPKTGSLLILGGVLFTIWSGMMVDSPSHISIHEVFPAWVLWIIITIILNGIVYLRVNSLPEVFFDDILDN
jgi:hypothetical protein